MKIINSFANSVIPPPVITIDGPSGSGKSTVRALLAEKLGWYSLDSGLVYRALALVVVENRLSLEDVESIVHKIAELDLRLANVSESDRIFVKGRDVSGIIRQEVYGDIASRIAVIPEVRAGLIQCQRDQRIMPGLVADGRDMGSTIFPDAILKIFLTANSEARSKRRLSQLRSMGVEGNFEDISVSLEERDKRDVNRLVSPLDIPKNAIVIDSTNLTPEEIVGDMFAYMNYKSV